MKKKILGLAFIAMSFTAFSGLAQNTATETTATRNCTQQECVKGKKADKAVRDRQVNPFEGLNLTDAQKTQLQQLDSKRKAAREEQLQARKADKQRDNATRVADRRASRKAYLEEVKAIVGPDQYVVFLENMYVNAGGNHNGKAAMGRNDRGKDQGKFVNARGNRNDKADRKVNGNKADRGHHASNRTAKTAAANS